LLDNDDGLSLAGQYAGRAANITISGNCHDYSYVWPIGLHWKFASGYWQMDYVYTIYF